LFRKFAADFSDRYKGASVQLSEEAKISLMNYPWPGNVRELKNIAEQISVLSKEKNISERELQKFLPDVSQFNRMPVLAGGKGAVSQQEFANEREILYKLFFDMKKDVNELKKMFFDILQNPSMVPHMPVYNNGDTLVQDYKPNMNSNTFSVSGQPVIINPHAEDIHNHVAIEESLSIMDKEKELIIKALKKHRGKRKDAASDLGISERTFNRKLKEYEIEDL
jgi:DNA-binding NtrC family response regulator